MLSSFNAFEDTRYKLYEPSGLLLLKRDLPDEDGTYPHDGHTVRMRNDSGIPLTLLQEAHSTPIVVMGIKKEIYALRSTRGRWRLLENDRSEDEQIPSLPRRRCEPSESDQSGEGGDCPSDDEDNRRKRK